MINVFDGGRVRVVLPKALAWCKEHKGHVATLPEVIQLRIDCLLPSNVWHDTSTFRFNDGSLKNLSLKELEDIEKLYKEDKGRLFFLGVNIDGLSGSISLNYSGRFVTISENKNDKRNKSKR